MDAPVKEKENRQIRFFLKKKHHSEEEFFQKRNHYSTVKALNEKMKSRFLRILYMYGT